MSQTVSLEASRREGKPNALRRAERIPAIIYGRGEASLPVHVDSRQFNRAFQAVGHASLLSLVVDGKAHNVLIRDVQYHPLKNHPTHIDFYQVRMDEKVKAEVPITLVGESRAVKDLSGILVHNIDALSIEALPQDLPHDIPVDISVLTGFDQAIHVRDLKLPAGVTVLADADEVVALVQPPRSDEELAKLSEEAKEDVQSVEGIKEEAPAEEAEAAGEKKE